MSKWFIPPPDKPVKIRVIENSEPPFPHVQFVRDQLDPFGLYIALEGPFERKGQHGEDQPSNRE